VTEVRPLAIEGVAVVDLEAHRDERGAMTELYRREWFPDGPEMVQANLSDSKAGVLRGMHFHRRQTDYWVLLDGVAFVGMVDLRRGSASERRAEHVRFDASQGLHGLLIPPGVAHGFLAETAVRLQYLVDLAFDGSDEHGVAWDDPDLGLAWPVASPTLSDRDRSNPSLAQVVAGEPILPRSGSDVPRNLG
jgi:dTDP-4-dehydrorhamnose 3,5-epimerase